MKPIHAIALSLISFTSLCAMPIALAAENTGGATPVKTMPAPAAPDANAHVKSTASMEAAKRRQLLVNEAVDARGEILQAILFLDKKDTKQAFGMLELADGKLNVILARNPNLKQVAIDVRTSFHDLESSPGAINAAIKEAKSALDNGHVQQARAALLPMTSEMRIYTDYLPLDIYPNAVKQASKQIQASKLMEAEATLADALGSIVTIEDVIPLPPVKAEGDVIEAEQLSNKDKVKNKDKVLSLLNSADNHLVNAKALGYGEYQSIRDEIASIKAGMETGSSKPNIFGRIKNFFHNMRHNNKA